MKESILFALPLVATMVLLSGCGDKNSASGNPAMAPVQYLDDSAKAKIDSEKKIDTIAINQAIQMYSTQEGHYPADLNELVTKKYMRALPQPPFGMKLVYDPANGEVTVVKK